jgi:hypothetical protein
MSVNLIKQHPIVGRFWMHVEDGKRIVFWVSGNAHQRRKWMRKHLKQGRNVSRAYRLIEAMK